MIEEDENIVDFDVYRDDATRKPGQSGTNRAGTGASPYPKHGRLVCAVSDDGPNLGFIVGDRLFGGGTVTEANQDGSVTVSWEDGNPRTVRYSAGRLFFLLGGERVARSES